MASGGHETDGNKRKDVRDVYCLAMSNHGRWIAGGKLWGEVIVWDTKTYKQK